MPGLRSEFGSASPRRMRLWLVLVAVGLVFVAAVFVVFPGVLRPVNEESAGTPAPTPSGIAPLPGLEPGSATLADIASIEVDFSRNAALYALIGDGTRARVEEWLGEVATLPATRHRADLARVLYIRFTVLDPEAALQHALRGATRASWLAAIFRTWGQVDPDAAAARAGALHRSAKAVASRALLELDLPRAELLAMAARLDKSRAGGDMERRIQLAAGKPRITQNEYLLAQIEARTHARREGESHADAWSRAIGVEETLVRQILVEQIIFDWSSTDPVAAMAAVDGWDTDDVYVPNMMGGGWAPSSPIQPMLRARIMFLWAQRDAQGALSWAMDQNRADAQRYVSTVLAVLAERAPADALARLADLPEPVRRQVAGSVLWTLARTDLDRALSLFETLSIEEQSEHSQAIRQELVSDRSPQSALDWALSLDRRIRPLEVAAVLGRIYAHDHAEALRLLGTIEDPSIRIAAAGDLVRRQVQRDAREALAWARNFQPEAERPKLVVQVFDTWSHVDPDGACRTLFETRGGPTRDRAAAAMMSGVVAHDSRLAERLFDSIETREHQVDAAQILHRHFTDIDPRQRKAERYRRYLPPEDDDPADGEDGS